MKYCKMIHKGFGTYECECCTNFAFGDGANDVVIMECKGDE